MIVCCVIKHVGFKSVFESFGSWSISSGDWDFNFIPDPGEEKLYSSTVGLYTYQNQSLQLGD